MNKKILIAGLLTLASVAGVVGTVGNANKVEAEEIKTIYLKPNGNWKENGAWFAARVWPTSGNDHWYKMEDTDNDGYYEADIDVGTYPNVIFCRMDVNKQELGWDSKWNQTNDLTFSENNNCYTVTEGAWSNGAGTWSTYTVSTPTPTPTHEKLSELVSPYVNNGYYIRETSINIDMTDKDVAQDLATAFHAKSIYTERTTYFEDDQLWMTNDESVNSGYGTSTEGMTHFSYVNGSKVVDYTVPGTTMEDYYTTLKDITINESQNWTESNGVYTSKNSDLIDKFLDFTAPCFLNTKDKNVTNVFTLDHVTIKETDGKLYLSLYVASDTKGFIKDKSTLLSTAIITKLNYFDVRGDFNGWKAGATKLVTAGQNNDNVFETTIELDKGEYAFKLCKNGDWYGNKGTYDSKQFGNAWDFWGDNNNNCKLVISEKGNYTFTIDNSETYPKLTITKK